MSKNFLSNNKSVGLIILFLYFIHLKYDIKFLQILFPNKLATADSWWYWPFKYVYDTSKYIYDNSKYIYESPKYLYDFVIYLFYPPIPIKPNTGFIIPYVKLNEPIIPPTEYEIAQEFFSRLNAGTWVYFLMFMIYMVFNYSLFWGFYSFFKANFFDLFSFKFFEVLQEKVKEVYFINIIIWFISQIYFFKINIWETYYMEWYYAFTTVMFLYLVDYILGNAHYYSSYGSYYKSENREEAFWCFKGQHLECFSMFWAFHMGVSVWLDYMDLLPYTITK